LEKERNIVKMKLDAAVHLIEEAKDIAGGFWCVILWRLSIPLMQNSRSTNQLNAATKSTVNREAGPSTIAKRPRLHIKSGPVKRIKIVGGDSIDTPIDLTGPPAVTLMNGPIKANVFRDTEWKY
jgi:hypothetical protein